MSDEASQRPVSQRPFLQRDAAMENTPGAGPEMAAISPPVSPQAQAILTGMKRATDEDANEDTSGNIRLAQADTGNASDAESVMPRPQPPKLQQTQPEPAPNSYRAGNLWPPFPKDWIGRDHLGNPVLTRQASDDLDAYKAQKVNLADQLEKQESLHMGLGQGDDKSLAAGLLKQYLAGDKDQVSLPPNKALREAPNVASAIDRMQTHVMDWLVNPNKTQLPEEHIVPKILALKDGESITVPSRWTGATGIVGYGAAANAKDSLAALGHVQVDGKCLAKVTRKGERLFVTVNIDNTLRDRYDYTDEDGQDISNQYLKDSGLPSVDFGKLALLAEAGRATPFDIGSHWKSEFTAKLIPTRSAGRIGSFNRFTLQQPQWRLLSDRSDIR